MYGILQVLQAAFSCNPILVSYCHLSHSPSHVLAAIKSLLLLLLHTLTHTHKQTHTHTNVIRCAFVIYIVNEWSRVFPPKITYINRNNVLSHYPIKAYINILMDT